MKKLMKVFRRIFSPSEKGLGEGGFTLIELLVVVAILGVLAAVVTLNVGGFIGQGQDEAKATELHNVQTAVIAYMADHDGSIPSGTGNLSDYLLGSLGYGTYTINQSTGVVTRN